MDRRQHGTGRYRKLSVQGAGHPVVRQHQGFDPPGRSPAGTLRQSGPPASRRGCHRAAPDRHPFSRPGTTGGAGHGWRSLRTGGAGSNRGRHFPRRAQRHRNRERHHGCRGGDGADGHSQRRRRAARAGSRAHAGGHGSPHRGNRLQRLHHRRWQGAHRVQLLHWPGPHRGGQLHRLGGGDQQS